MNRYLIIAALLAMGLRGLAQEPSHEYKNAIKFDALGTAGFALGFIGKMNGRVSVEYQRNITPKKRIALIAGLEYRIRDVTFNRYWQQSPIDSILLPGASRQHSYGIIVGMRYSLPIVQQKTTTISIDFDALLEGSNQFANLYPSTTGIGFLKAHDTYIAPRLRTSILFTFINRLAIEPNLTLARWRVLGDNSKTWQFRPGLNCLVWF